MMRMFRKWISAPSDSRHRYPFFCVACEMPLTNFAVHRQLDDAVDRNDVIGVPLALALAAVLDRHASITARVVRRGLDAADAEQLPVNVGDRRRDAVHFVEIGPFELQHLDLDAVGQPCPGIGLRVAPREDARVAAGFHVHPLDVQHEILVLLRCAHHPDGMTRADQKTVADPPGVLGGIDVDPTRKVPAVEESHERLRRLACDGHSGQQTPQHGERREARHSGGRLPLWGPIALVADLVFDGTKKMHGRWRCPVIWCQT